VGLNPDKLSSAFVYFCKRLCCGMSLAVSMLKRFTFIISVITLCEGYIRFGRAALAVGRIGLDYRKSLFKTKYEEPTHYEAAKKEHQAPFFFVNPHILICNLSGYLITEV
jgi:hypothetical protein